jgi:transposase
MSSVAQAGLVFLGLDVSKNSISVGVLAAGSDSVVVDKIFSDEESVRRLVGRFGDPRSLRVCYEAGPTGFWLARLLASMGVSCLVVAPSLVPRAPGDRVKTDRRDARRLTRLLRAGELVAIHVPTPAEEAVRDLCRARADVLDDRKRARQRRGAFLLRHDVVYRGGEPWTGIHQRWLSGLRLDDRALQTTLDYYRAVLTERDAMLTAIESDLAHWVDHGPFAEATHRLSAYRGIAHLGGLTIASEVGDWRRFRSAVAFMGFTGLVPGERSSGETIRRGHITKAGNAVVRTQLVESAWAYQHRPAIGATLRRRQNGLGADTLARSWTAQQRLCRRYRTLAAGKNVTSVAITAVARELAGFCWAEMTTSG